jgi:hypothetical protein
MRQRDRCWQMLGSRQMVYPPKYRTEFSIISSFPHAHPGASDRQPRLKIDNGHSPRILKAARRMWHDW